MTANQMANVLRNIARLLELKGENPFKTRAYANAARTLESLSEPLDQVIAGNRLGEIKGIGEALQQKITTLVTTGKLPYYEELKASVPAGLMEMLNIPGLGPKKVKVLHDKLAIETVEQLEAALRIEQMGRRSAAYSLDVRDLPAINQRLRPRQSMATTQTFGSTLAI
jgi:DNA polymerase (family 10)